MSHNLENLGVPLQLKTFAEEAQRVAKSFVTPAHMEAIANYCKKNKVSLSIRETGVFSLFRILQGAKAKPHSILEKTIKPGSLSKSHPELSDLLAKSDLGSYESSMESKLGELEIEVKGVGAEDLVGFVGHWSSMGSLMGLRLDHKDILKEGSARDPDLEKIQEFITIDPVTEEPYIKLSDFKNYKEKMGQQWAQFLYTGDYDLGEIYKNKKPLAEGSAEKARVLKGLNDAIARSQTADTSNTKPIRKGSFAVKKAEFVEESGRRRSSHLLHTEEGSDWAMFQHGDQMGYLTNQINELLANEAKEKQERRPSDKENQPITSSNEEKQPRRSSIRDILRRRSSIKENPPQQEAKKAELVEAVSKEPNEPLAWCDNGKWFVTNNKKEHQTFRKANKFNVSSAWNEKTVSKIKENRSSIFKYKM